MIERMTVGAVAAKHHTQLREGGPGRNASGALRYEECFTRDGFDGPYTILYHVHRPQTQKLDPRGAQHGWKIPQASPPVELQPLAKRHYVTPNLKRPGGGFIDAQVALMYSDDLTCGVASPTAIDPVYVSNGDGDELVYIHRGAGTLHTMLGDVAFAQGDYVFVPRALVHRFAPTSDAQEWLWFELRGGLHLPKQFRNDVGQLRMDAPYCHRDFKRPLFVGPTDDGVREQVVKQGDRWHGFIHTDPPFDVVGWDGTVYPWAFPILNFQPRVSSVHIPPTWHGTFAGRGALICSFVPRLVDFHPDAIPCPYPHSSTHCDEIIFYCDGNFTSRRGVGPGSISWHPMGVPHGPHPGSYEKSIGTTRTDETAVMVDAFKPLLPTAAALGIEDSNYQDSFI